MSSRHQGRFDDATLDAIAETLALGQPLSSDLALVWQAAQQDPELHRRVDESRSWWSLLSRATALGLPSDHAVLVLKVKLSGRAHASVLAVHGQLQQVLVLDANGQGQIHRVAVDGTVQLSDRGVTLAKEGEELLVSVRGTPEVARGVVVEVSDLQGQPVARATTDEAGGARMRIGRRENVRVVLRWQPAIREINEL